MQLNPQQLLRKVYVVYSFDIFLLYFSSFVSYFTCHCLTALETLVEKRITGFPVIDDDWKLVTLVIPYTQIELFNSFIRYLEYLIMVIIVLQVGVVSDYDLLALDSISGITVISLIRFKLSTLVVLRLYSPCGTLILEIFTLYFLSGSSKLTTISLVQQQLVKVYFLNNPYFVINHTSSKCSSEMLQSSLTFKAVLFFSFFFFNYNFLCVSFLIQFCMLTVIQS